MLLFLFLSSALQLGTACQKIPLYYGSLNATLALPGGTLTGVTSSCQCCGICYQDKRCKSFSFRPLARECTMYSQVGGYPAFFRQQSGEEDTEFYIMPHSSTTGEFCRQNADCLTGEPCMAKMCTTNTTITCRTIKELNPTTPIHSFWGAVNGTEIRLHCNMNYGSGGWTLLVNAPFNHFWQPQDVNSFNSIGEGTIQTLGKPYSALWTADLIRDSRPGDYNVIVRSEAPETGVLFTAPRAQSLHGTAPVQVSYKPDHSEHNFAFAAGSVVFPYMLNKHGVVYHMNGDQSADVGGIMRSYEVAGDRWALEALRPHTIQVWIREGQ